MEQGQTTVQASTVTTEPAKTTDQETKVSQQQAEQKFKVKISDQEMEVPISDLIKRYQLEEAADRRFKTAAEKERKLAELIEKIQDPDEYFSTIAKINPKLNPDEWAERRLLKKLELQVMTPEQRRAYEAERRAEEYEKQLRAREQEHKKLKEDLDKGKLEELQSKHAAAIDKLIPETFSKHGIPKNAAAVARTLEYAIAYSEANGTSIKDSIEKIVPKVQRDLMSDLKDVLSTMPAEEAVKVLPKELADKLRREDIQKLNRNFTRSTTSTPQARSTSSKKIRASTDDFFDMIDRKIT
jgi:hypothetical protein